MALNRNPHHLTASDWQEYVRTQIASVRYGSIEIVIHNSQIVEIDRTDRLRLPPAQEPVLNGIPIHLPEHSRTSD